MGRDTRGSLMAEPDRFEAARENVLDLARYDRKWKKVVGVIGGILETAFGITFFLLMDTDDRLHILLALSVVFLYTVIVLKFASDLYQTERSTQTILKAIGLITPTRDEQG